MLDVTALDPTGSLPPPAVTTDDGANPFVHVRAGRIVDADGTPLLLRGVGLGNWLLPEGYMWGFGAEAASPRQIEALITTLVGEPAASAFWTAFRARFITEADIAQIALEGFDHVRLPLNWRVLMTAEGAWLEEGFACVDRLIGWCRTHGLRVLLDLHGAPGGQTGTNIDDSLGRPELFMDQRNVVLTIALWTEIARRYRDEAAVLGYDLLNEPLPDEWQHRYAAELVVLYRQLTAAIRAVDPLHVIMYEGTHWATNWEIFTEVWDPNSVLQFHKYWSATDRPSIQRFLDVGAALELPVYMGEGGENTPEWLAAATQLYEDCGVGWNFWPWKKIDTLSSPCSVPPPAGWDAVLAFAAGRADAPAPEEVERILAELLDSMAPSSCDYRQDVVNALMRRAPVTLPAYGFTFRAPGESYGASGDPHPGLRPDDSVTLRRRDGQRTLDFAYPPVGGEGAIVVADLAPGQWLEFEADLPVGSWVVGVMTDRLAGDDQSHGPSLCLDGAAAPMAPSAGGAGEPRWSSPVVRARPGRIAIRVTAAHDSVTLVSVDVAAAP